MATNDYGAEIEQAASETLSTVGNNDWRQAPKRAEEVAELTSKVREIEQRAAADQTQPNADDLQWINQRMATKDENGRRRYEVDSQYRQRLEQARAKVFRGESIADFRKNSDADLSGQPRPAQQPARPAVDPNASPADQLIQRIESGDVIGLDELPDNLRSEFTGGYNVRLPDGYGLTAADSADLQAARAAGLTQAQVDKIVAERLKS